MGYGKTRLISPMQLDWSTNLAPPYPYFRVNSEAESLVFDKRYYEEILRRAWIPRNLDDDSVPQDWTWGGSGNDEDDVIATRVDGGGDVEINLSPRFMLNTGKALGFVVRFFFVSR